MKSWKPWLGALVLLVAAGGWWARRDRERAPVRSWPTPWNLAVVDRTTGQPIANAVWTLIATRERALGRSFDEGLVQGALPAAPPPEALAQAQRMAVGAYGYEVRILEPDGLHALGGRVDLEPAADATPVSLDSEDGAVTSRTATLMLSTRDPDAPASARSLWWLHRGLTLTRQPTVVPVGRRQAAIVVPEPSDGSHVEWPFPLTLAANRPAVLHVETTRRVAFGGPGREPLTPASFGWLHVDPRAVPTLGDGRCAGLAMHGSLGYEATPTTSGPVFAHVPRVPLTGVVHGAAGWLAVELDAEAVPTRPLPLDRAPLRRLTTVSIDAAPPPEGAVIVPGTVADELVNALLARGWLELDGLGLRAPKPDAWAETRLPSAESLTVWHRDHGLARLAWAESGAAVGAWEPGFVHVRRHPGCRARGVVSVRSGCVGSPLVSSGTSRVDGMERPLGETAVSLLGGIPFGPATVEVRTWRVGATGPEVLRRRVSLDDGSPCIRFSLAEDGSVSYEGTGSVPRDGG